MPAFYSLGETRLVQVRNAVSAANADSLSFSAAVPDGKLWIVTGFGYYPSVAETQTISIFKSIPFFSQNFGLLNPVQLALNPAVCTFIEQGMEYMLMPREVISITRGNHTAGSTMNANMQFIEIDQPLYTYDEPQAVKRQTRALSTIRMAIGGATGSRGGGGSPVPPAGRGRPGGTPPAM